MNFINVALAISLLPILAACHVWTYHSDVNCTGTASPTTVAAEVCRLGGRYSWLWSATQSGSCISPCDGSWPIPCGACVGTRSTWSKYVCDTASKVATRVVCTDNACSVGCAPDLYGLFNFSTATCPAGSPVGRATVGSCSFIDTIEADGDSTCTTATSRANRVCDVCLQSWTLTCDNVSAFPTSRAATTTAFRTTTSRPTSTTRRATTTAVTTASTTAATTTVLFSMPPPTPAPTTAKPNTPAPTASASALTTAAVILLIVGSLF